MNTPAQMRVLNEEITSVTGQCVKDLRLSMVLQEVEFLGCDTVLLGEWISFLEVL